MHQNLTNNRRVEPTAAPQMDMNMLIVDHVRQERQRLGSGIPSTQIVNEHLRFPITIPAGFVVSSRCAVYEFVLNQKLGTTVRDVISALERGQVRMDLIMGWCAERNFHAFEEVRAIGIGYPEQFGPSRNAWAAITQRGNTGEPAQ